METHKTFDCITEKVLQMGAANASVISTDLIALDASFRDMCASNACGLYGKCWMCPPDVGDIEQLMKDVRGYQYALVYQTVSDIEDSYDFEGMVNAKKSSYKVNKNIRSAVDGLNLHKVLYLGAGGCGVCERCAKRDEQPCRFPELATPSLEAYGINVSQLAKAAEMKYVNGANTVTYFGAILFSTEPV